MTELGIEPRIDSTSTNETQDAPNNSLDTPSRDSNATNPMNGSGGATNATIENNNNNHPNSEYENNMLISKSKHIHSSLKSSNNPLTIARERKLKEGQQLLVNFDERVVVHTVPYWDPCGETFYDNDDEDGPRGPNCCIIL